MDRDTINQLSAVRLFEGIDEQDIPPMLGCIGGREHHYAKGEYIFMESDDLKRIGLIISGTVQMIKEDIWGGKMVLLNLTPGALFGESFVCNDKVASTVSFMASANCRILLLSFRRLLTTCGLACKFHQRLIENMVVVIADKNITMMNKMEILSKANTDSFGNPELTKVNIGVGKNPGILISGHDLRDLEQLLEQTQGTGVDVYTHSEMLPAHYYPFFKKYKNLVGNYGNAWWKQKEEFESFNGPILMTTNCLVPPKDSYKDRVYNTGAVGFPGCKYIPGGIGEKWR